MKRKTEKRSRVEAGIIQGLREALAYERGELPNVKVKRVALTARSAVVQPVPSYPATKIKHLREVTKLSQPVFAQALNVSAETVKAWEQGRRSPDGAALRLLQVVEKHPRILSGMVHA